jgi:general stress protein 26
MAKTATASHPHAEDLKKLSELVKDVRFAMMTTVELDGSLRSRPMATQQTEFDGDAWFFTTETAPKVDEVEHDRRVNLSYAAKDDNVWVSMSGTAEVVRDRAKMEELWNPALKAWFPDGLDQSDLALIKVHVEQAEYWDATSNKIAFVGGMLKSIAKGESYQPGENEKLDLSDTD